MPCMGPRDPTERQVYNSKTVDLLIKLLQDRGLKPSRDLLQSSKSAYCDDDYTIDLCGILNEMGENGRKEFFLGSLNTRWIRDLLSWWEDHEELDRSRREREERKAASEMVTKSIRERALAKLTDEEIHVLGLRRK